MRVDFYYYADCPSHEQALERLREVIDEEGLPVEIVVTEVMSDDEARRLKFVGSPTIRLNEVDIDPTSAERHDYGLSCRAYRRADGRISPLPPREMIQAALRRAQ